MIDENPPNLHPAQLEFLRSMPTPGTMHVFCGPKTSMSGVRWLHFLATGKDNKLYQMPEGWKP